MSSRLLHGDCLEVLASLPDASVDACVTDPPYELGFMGKSWDATGIAFNPAVWREVLRVLKPGAHLLACGGTRTYHRMAVAVEDAGFEIRDSIAWIYGTGFPKSMDVSHAIDRARDDDADRRAVGMWLRSQRAARGFTQKDVAAHWPSASGGLTGCVANWELGLNCPTWDQWLKLKRLIGFSDEIDAEVWRLNGRKGTPGNERSDREVGAEGENQIYQPLRQVVSAGTPVLPEAARWKGWGTALKPAIEPIVLARKPIGGTVVANVLKHGTGALHIDGGRVDGRWPPNVAMDPATAMLLDYANEGASSFFYIAKPSREERDYGCQGLATRTAGECTDRREGSEGLRNPRAGAGRTGGRRNFHPTVKPVELMRWLVKLVTPINGVVIDPFMGSGTTGMACRYELRDFIGIEREAEYLEIAERRIAAVAPLFSESA